MIKIAVTSFRERNIHDYIGILVRKRRFGFCEASTLSRKKNRGKQRLGTIWWYVSESFLSRGGGKLFSETEIENRKCKF
jgi:hypothetical protein